MLAPLRAHTPVSHAPHHRFQTHTVPGTVVTAAEYPSDSALDPLFWGTMHLQLKLPVNMAPTTGVIDRPGTPSTSCVCPEDCSQYVGRART